MKETKFKAFHSKTKEWWYFSLVDLVSNQELKKDWFRLEHRSQYIGLRDKNGNKIYGKCDILCAKSKGGFEHKDTIELGWSSDGRYGFIWSTSRNIVVEQDFIDERYEIIGTIPENPELLPESK